MIQWEFIGRLHPLVLHLPIGLIFGLFLLEGLALFVDPDARVWRVCRKAYIGLLALSSIAAAFTGYILSLEGQSGGVTLTQHKWLGLAAAVLSLFLFTLTLGSEPSSESRKRPNLRLLVLLVLFALITVTGHLGGQLTHGPRFLSQFAPPLLKPLLGPPEPPKPAPVETVETDIPAPTTAVEPLIVYEDFIQPILVKYCGLCHGADRQTADLAVHTPEALMAGGWSGPVLVPGNAQDSELLKRIWLPLDDPGRMPPKGKAQLEASQVKALEWWINNGAAFDASLKRDEVPSELEPLLPQISETQVASEPALSSAPPDESLLNSLLERQVFIQRIQQDDQRLWVAFPALADQVTDETVEELLPLAPFIAWLDLSNTQITSQALATIVQMPELTELNLRETRIEAEALQVFTEHEKLERLNLSLVPLNDSVVDTLLKIPNLRKVYLGGTQLSAAAIQRLTEPRIEVILKATPSEVLEAEPNQVSEK